MPWHTCECQGSQPVRLRCPRSVCSIDLLTGQFLAITDDRNMTPINLFLRDVTEGLRDQHLSLSNFLAGSSV